MQQTRADCRPPTQAWPRRSQCAGWHPTGANRLAITQRRRWLALRAYVAAMLGASGAALRLNTPLTGAAPERHRLGSFIAPMVACWLRTGLLVLAGGHARRALARAMDPPGRELIMQRGQISRVAPAPARLSTTLAGDGYAIDAGPEGFFVAAPPQTLTQTRSCAPTMSTTSRA